MPASEAQIRANQMNAQKSSGPKTPEGKAASSANALKHGLTAVKVFPQREAEEVQRRYLAYCAELRPSGEVGMAFVLRAATLSTRMERCVEHETAALTERVRKAQAEFVPPEGCTPEEAHQLRVEAGKRALFDPSKEAILARRYEQAAERGFFKALKELRAHERAIIKAEDDEVARMSDELLGSFVPADELAREFDEILAEEPRRGSRPAVMPAEPVDFAALGGRVDVPITIGKCR